MYSRRDWPLSGRWMERVILQTLTEVRNLQTGSLFKLAQIDQTFVCDSAILVGESDIVVWLQPLGDIVGVEQGDL